MSTRIPSTYLCLACKHRTTPFSTSFLRAAPSNEKASFTEKVRQKIWGTHQPPGLEDPYGDGSVFDRTKKREQRQRIQAREQEPEEAPVEVEETATEVEETETDNTRSFGRSERATNWDGLQWVGGGTLWQPEDDFKGFLPADATTDREHTTAALHRAMVEVFALQQAGKPLHKLSTHFPGIDGFNDWTDNVQLTPSSSGATVQMPEQTSLREVMESLAAPKMIDDEHEVEPTQSQEDISADKSQDDPLKYGVLPVTEPTPELDESTEFEEENAVDQVPEESLVARTFHDVISSWDPSWLQISLGNPEVKFAVSHIALCNSHSNNIITGLETHYATDRNPNSRRCHQILKHRKSPAQYSRRASETSQTFRISCKEDRFASARKCQYLSHQKDILCQGKGYR
jgi:hypothetical protein